jgi:hypothetical protein
MSIIRLPQDDYLWNPRPHHLTPDQYAARRDSVLAAGDWKKLKSWALQMGNTALPSDAAIEISFNQMVALIPDLPSEARLRSRQWLNQAGYR